MNIANRQRKSANKQKISPFELDEAPLVNGAAYRKQGVSPANGGGGAVGGFKLYGNPR